MIHLLAQATGASDSTLLMAFILLAVALGLFAIEIFVPSGGLLALLGALAVVGSVVAFFMHDVTVGFMAMGTYVLLGPVVVWLGFRIWAASPLARSMVLGGTVEEDADEAYQASEHARQERADYLGSLVGRTGETMTVLRPVGVVRIDGRRVDAMAETGSIDAGRRVEVVRTYDNQVKVREVSE